MVTSIISIVVFISVVVFIFYKRDMLIQMFTVDLTSPTHRFQKQLEQTADLVIKRLEEQIIHLEYLLEDANEKIIHLDNKIQMANIILNKDNNNVKEDLSPLLSSDSRSYSGIVANEIATMNIDHYKEMGRTNKRTLIIEMADLGHDITEIAKATGISKGEIMLLLQLNKKRTNNKM